MKKIPSTGVKRYTLSKQVADKLEKMIESGTYPIDSRIPTEPELMELFQVSRNTVREAVQSLMSAGLLEVRQGDGTYVRSVDRFQANMSKQYDKVSAQDITLARNAIEVSISRLAAQRRTDDDLRAMATALENRKHLTDNATANAESDLRFHLAVADACHNCLLIDLYRSMADYMTKHICHSQLESPLNQEEINSRHEQLYRAIADKDVEKAGLAAINIINI